MPMKPYYFQLNYYKANKKEPRVVLIQANFCSVGKARKWAQEMQVQACKHQKLHESGTRSRPKFEMKNSGWYPQRSQPPSLITNPGQITIENILRKRAYQCAA